MLVSWLAVGCPDSKTLYQNPGSQPQIWDSLDNIQDGQSKIGGSKVKIWGSQATTGPSQAKPSQNQGQVKPKLMTSQAKNQGTGKPNEDMQSQNKEKVKGGEGGVRNGRGKRDGGREAWREYVQITGKRCEHCFVGHDVQPPPHSFGVGSTVDQRE